jgi:hypothetical protein
MVEFEVIVIQMNGDGSVDRELARVETKKYYTN